MKTSIIIACLILFCCINSINAQWYNYKYGVENLNDLSNDQLMEGYSHAEFLSVVGGVVTGTGIVLTLGGVVKATINTSRDEIVSGINSVFGGEPVSSESYGEGLLISGAVLAIGGAVLCISGGSRKKQIRPIIESRGIVSNISVQPGVGYELLSDTLYIVSLYIMN